MDSIIGAKLLYQSVRDTAIQHGVDLAAHPWDVLTAGSRALWVDTWNHLIAELGEREYVFGQWSNLSAMIQSGQFASAWKALADKEGPADA